MKKFYEGKRNEIGTCSVRVFAGSLVYELPLRLDVWNHSPTGFQWGYGGSGPAQLALAILCDALQDETEAALLHQRFKANLIAGMRANHWRLPVEEVLQWVIDERPEYVIDPRNKPSRQ